MQAHDDYDDEPGRPGVNVGTVVGMVIIWGGIAVLACPAPVG
jgi:hypothetical protein